MEGTKCSEKGCGENDFLPFDCSKCLGKFCLHHRSRFQHTCLVTHSSEVSGLKSDTTRIIGPSYRSLAQSVENRFENEGQVGSSQEHFRVQTSKSDVAGLPSASFKAKIQKLDTGFGSSTKKSDKQRSIEEKTKRILIKSKSKGLETVLPDDRFHLCFKCSGETDTPPDLFLFFNKNTKVGDILHHIASTYPQLTLGSLAKSPGSSLGVYTVDTPDWKQWDRNTIISDAFSEFETLQLIQVSTTEAVAAQAIIEQKNQNLCVVTEEKFSESSAKGSSADSLADKRNFSKGDHAAYRTTTGEEEFVTVVGVHLDDFPNVYYTIFQPSTSRERQTDSARLRELTAAEACLITSVGSKVGEVVGGSGSNSASVTSAATVTGDQFDDDDTSSFFVNVTYGSRKFVVGGLDAGMTVKRLKEGVSRKAGVAVAAQKLICRGKILQDHQIIGATFSNAAKITLMAQSPSR